MLSVKWHQRRVTDSSKRILEQISSRAIDRGLALRVADQPSIVMLALWSVLLWERKLGLADIEHAGGNRFDLIRALDQSLQRKASELPVAFDMDREVGCDNPQRGVVVVSEPDQPVVRWDSEDLLEPLFRQAKDEAQELGHDYIGSEHLVLAIVKLADPTLQTLLRECGVTHERVKEAVVALLRPEG